MHRIRPISSFYLFLKHIVLQSKLSKKFSVMNNLATTLVRKICREFFLVFRFCQFRLHVGARL